MGALVEYPVQHRPRTAEIPDPRGCATALFDELARATGLSDAELATRVREATHDPMVDERLIARWRRGPTSPSLYVAWCLLWTAGPAAIPVIVGMLNG